MTRDTTTFVFTGRAGLAVLAGAALGLAVGQAAAGELCVTCTDPAAVYRCAIEGDAPGSTLEPGLQLHCIKELASTKGHRSCSVDRTRGKAPCEGTPVTLARPAGGIVPAATPPAPVPPPPDTADAGAAAAAPVPGPQQPPATVEELAKQTAEQGKKDWEKTNDKLKEGGQAVGGAVKKSWDCLISLFSRC